VIILVDTHILLWWFADDPSLSSTARELIQPGGNEVFVSAASAWEIAIKRALGKLEAPNDLPAALEANRFEVLPITVSHALAAGALPRHHLDPFDRMLVAQAGLERMILATHDNRLCRYGSFVKLV
jgi:PIN domain nuclease of toxin-antitoxin system